MYGDAGGFAAFAEALTDESTCHLLLSLGPLAPLRGRHEAGSHSRGNGPHSIQMAGSDITSLAAYLISAEAGFIAGANAIVALGMTEK